MLNHLCKLNKIFDCISVTNLCFTFQVYNGQPQFIPQINAQVGGQMSVPSQGQIPQMSTHVQGHIPQMSQPTQSYVGQLPNTQNYTR